MQIVTYAKRPDGTGTHAAEIPMDRLTFDGFKTAYGGGPIETPPGWDRAPEGHVLWKTKSGHIWAIRG